jgi:AcrR family transcriptional regulator
VDDDIPASLRRLWSLNTPARRGRPAELDGRSVIAEAVAFADAEGLDEVTIPKLAKRLGYSPMALYRYVGSKEELLELMRDAVYADVYETAGDGDWRAGLSHWARAHRRLLHRHPWVTVIPTSGPPSGPNVVTWMELGLKALSRTGLDWTERIGVLMLVDGYVRSFARMSADLAAGREKTGRDQMEVERRYAVALFELIDPERFPEVAALMRSGIFGATPPGDDPAFDPDFVFGLERILDGVAVSVDAAENRRELVLDLAFGHAGGGHLGVAPAVVAAVITEVGAVTDRAVVTGGPEAAVAVGDADVSILAGVPVHERAQRRVGVAGVGLARVDGALPVRDRRGPHAGGAPGVLRRHLAVLLVVGAALARGIPVDGALRGAVAGALGDHVGLGLFGEARV